MKFYCQLDYAQVPYPSPTSPNGTIADNGCGVCTVSMVVENLLHEAFAPEESARLAKACGAREGYGTDLYIFADAVAARFGVRITHTEDAEAALAFLAAGGGMVIANVNGGRAGYAGVFSDGGHYVVLAEARGRSVCVWDPMYFVGSDRFDRPGRREKVRPDGLNVWADIAVLAEDCHERPFFLIEGR